MDGARERRDTIRQLAELRRRLAAAETALADAQAAMKRAETALADAQAAMKRAETAFDAANDRFAGAERALDVAREERAQARRERYVARQVYEQASTAADRLARRVRELAERLDRMPLAGICSVERHCSGAGGLSRECRADVAQCLGPSQGSTEADLGGLASLMLDAPAYAVGAERGRAEMLPLFISGSGRVQTRCGRPGSPHRPCRSSGSPRPRPGNCPRGWWRSRCSSAR